MGNLLQKKSSSNTKSKTLSVSALHPNLHIQQSEKQAIVLQKLKNNPQYREKLGDSKIIEKFAGVLSDETLLKKTCLWKTCFVDFY